MENPTQMKTVRRSDQEKMENDSVEDDMMLQGKDDCNVNKHENDMTNSDGTREREVKSIENTTIGLVEEHKDESSVKDAIEDKTLHKEIQNKTKTPLTTTADDPTCLQECDLLPTEAIENLANEEGVKQAAKQISLENSTAQAITPIPQQKEDMNNDALVDKRPTKELAINYSGTPLEQKKSSTDTEREISGTNSSRSPSKESNKQHSSVNVKDKSDDASGEIVVSDQRNQSITDTTNKPSSISSKKVSSDKRSPIPVPAPRSTTSQQQIATLSRGQSSKAGEETAASMTASGVLQQSNSQSQPSKQLSKGKNETDPFLSLLQSSREQKRKSIASTNSFPGRKNHDQPQMKSTGARSWTNGARLKDITIREEALMHSIKKHKKREPTNGSKETSTPSQKAKISRESTKQNLDIQTQIAQHERTITDSVEKATSSDETVYIRTKVKSVEQSASVNTMYPSEDKLSRQSLPLVFPRLLRLKADDSYGRTEYDIDEDQRPVSLGSVFSRSLRPLKPRKPSLESIHDELLSDDHINELAKGLGLYWKAIQQHLQVLESQTGSLEDQKSDEDRLYLVLSTWNSTCTDSVEQRIQQLIYCLNAVCSSESNIIIQEIRKRELYSLLRI